jgi:SAM-dependent methyltransferase
VYVRRVSIERFKKYTLAEAIHSNIRLYLVLYKSGRLKLVFFYFLNCQFYDLIHKTDTHRMLSKKDMQVDSPNLEHSLMYMVSWTSTLRSALARTSKIINPAHFDFLDLGCGKGKACLVARQSQFLGSENLSYYGVDFEPQLVKVAISNSLKLFGEEGNFIECDVTKMNWNKFSENLIIYMYNPFNSLILTQVLNQLKSKNVLFIYCNPVELDTFIKFGYRVLHSTDSWHANLNFKILGSHKIEEVS